MTVSSSIKIKNSTCRVILVRHGQSEVYGRPWKSKDLPLSELGIKQARAVSQALENESISAVFSSPMRRALQTAEIISEPHGLPILPVNGFSEIDTGIFSNKSNSEVLKHGEDFKDIILKAREAPLVAQLLDYYPGLAFPGGESVGQMVQRVVKAWEDLIENINCYPVSVVVSHAGTQTVILRHLSSYILSKDLKKQKFSNAGISEVEILGGKKFSIKRINDISHLQTI